MLDGCSPSYITNVDNQPVTWRIFPLLEDKRRSALFVVIVALAVVAVQVGFGERWLTVLALLFLLASLRMFWTPTYYRIDARGITVSTPFYRVTHQWSRFRIIKDDPRGIVLSPFRSNSRLEAFRALFLRVPLRDKVLKSEIRAACEQYLNAAPSQTNAASVE